MSSALFVAAAYPWSRREAEDFWKALYKTITEPADVRILYGMCGDDLASLNTHQRPDLLWHDDLDNLAAAGVLWKLCGAITATQRYKAVHKFAAQLELAFTQPLMPVEGARGPSLNSLGSIHLHIDGAQAAGRVRQIVSDHRRHGYKTELTSVQAFIGGPQRPAYDDTYKMHTPGVEKEELDYFSTTVLCEGADAPDDQQWATVRRMTRNVLADLHQRPEKGVVVELERVAGRVDADGRMEVVPAFSTPEHHLRRLFEDDALLFSAHRPQVSGSRLYELHFAVDIPRSEGADSAIAIEELLRVSSAAGLSVGGWFLFADNTRWAFRSNSFEDSLRAEDLVAIWTKMNAKLRAHADSRMRDASLRLLAEETLAVWKSPLTKIDGQSRTIDELAKWEEQVPNSSNFWVVAPNFLGDQVESVQNAMIKNLNRSVHYTYFLRSHADAKRWLDFRLAMAEEAPGAERYLDAHVLRFTDQSGWFDQLAFIAEPGKDTAAGVRLRLDPVTKGIYGGVAMSSAEIAQLVSSLYPMLNADRIRYWQRVERKTDLRRVAVLCLRVGLRDGAVSSWRFRESLDAEIATAVSQHEGEVARHDEQTYIIIFRSPWVARDLPRRVRAQRERVAVSHAVRCAVRLFRQRATSQEPLVVTFAIDYEKAEQRAWSYGMRWVGNAVDGALDLLDRTSGAIQLTHRAAVSFKEQDPWPDVEVWPTEVSGVFEIVFVHAPPPQ